MKTLQSVFLVFLASVLLLTGSVAGSVLAQTNQVVKLSGWPLHHPWSGWWWPSSNAVRGPHLYDLVGSPLAKYDQLVTQRSEKNPGTLEWERQEMMLSESSWLGHCNGWAAASVLETEPFQPVTVDGITFSVADQKGLLSAYHLADKALWQYGTLKEPLSAVDFHRQLVQSLGVQQQSVILAFNPSGDPASQETWNYPVVSFELTMEPDASDPAITNVSTTVQIVSNDVSPDFVGVKLWKGEPHTYTYRLFGPPNAPTGGEWITSLTTRPFGIWYPDASERAEGFFSPTLDYQIIQEILGRR